MIKQPSTLPSNLKIRHGKIDRLQVPEADVPSFKSSRPGLPVPNAGAPSFKRNRITGKPDIRTVNRQRLTHFEKKLGAMTAVGITGVITGVALEHKNISEALASMDI